MVKCTRVVLSFNTVSTDRAKGVTDAKAWIGGNDLSSEGGWEWSDGTAFRYIQWNSGKFFFIILLIINLCLSVGSVSKSNSQILFISLGKGV